MSHDSTFRKNPILGVALLTTAATIWGFAFVPQKYTVLAFSALSATVLRFMLATPFAVSLALPRYLKDRQGYTLTKLRSSMALGAILFVCYFLQTAGLVYAPVVRVSLITGLYAVMVPFLAPLFGLPKPQRMHWLGAIIATIGVCFLVGVVDMVTGGAESEQLTALNIGDVLTFGHAFFGALHVLTVARFTKNVDPFVVNATQLVSCLFICIVAIGVFGGADLRQVVDIDARTLLSFGYLAAFSTVVGFTCQIVGQRHASAPAAAVVLLLETPVGAMGAMLIFGERMSFWQWVGALVMLVGIVVSLWPEMQEHRAQRAADRPT